MGKKDSTDFDSWWQEKKNRYELMEIYHTTADFNIAVMDIAEAAWRGAINANKSNNNNTENTENTEKNNDIK